MEESERAMQDAAKQIETREYARKLARGCTNILKIVIVSDGKKVLGKDCLMNALEGFSIKSI